MKFKSNKNWATVLCAAAVFSLITLGSAQAAAIRPDILPPPPIGGTTDETVPDPRILPPPPIDGETLNGDFSGTMMVD